MWSRIEEAGMIGKIPRGWDEKDFYKLLRLSPDASGRDVKRARKQMARKFHPDRHGGTDEANERFAAINEAADVLSDAESRRLYDAVRPRTRRVPPPRREPSSPGEPSFSDDGLY